MDASKDYYAILGVLPSIEQTALKAVYLALLKKYHPDVYKGNISDAERITKQLNEAYSILGDQTRRAEYDALRKTRNSNDGDFSQEPNSESNDIYDEELERNWKYIADYYPEAENYRQELNLISRSLSITFQLIIITEKLSERSKEVSEHLKTEYMRRYFGSNEKIQNFALRMLKTNRRDVALEINNIICVIGTPSEKNVNTLINKISIKFKLKIDYQNEINKIYKTYKIFNNGEYYAELKNGEIIGSLNNIEYYIFDNIEHYRKFIKEEIFYVLISGDRLTSEFIKKLENQEILMHYK